MDEEECVLITPASEIMKQAKYRQARKKHKRTKRRIMRKFYAGSFAMVAVYAVFTYLRTFTSSGDVTAAHGRKLSGGHGCDYTSTLLKDAQNDPEIWGILYLLVTLYWFIGIAIVCDYFFEPSLGEISDALNLSPDVAGATFMAAGSSAPELFTSMADTFTTSNNIGIGTIVGSAMFNILIIVAAAAMAAGQELKIDWRCIARDVGFYGMSVAMLVFFFWDDKATAIEGLIMVLAYMLYVLFMVFNEQLLNKMGPPPGSDEAAKSAAGAKVMPDTGAGFSKDNALSEIEKGANEQQPPSEGDGENKNADDSSKSKLGNAFKTGLEMTITGDGGGDDDDDDEDLWEWPKEGKVEQFFFILSVPFKVCFVLTIPDCNKEKWKKYYWVTFFSCIVWLGICCAAMANLASAIGCLWGIDAFIMGVVVLAVGTSVPDAMASIIVAKAGEGDMAIANAIGSNVFDILLGLGFPWFLYGVTGFCEADAGCKAVDTSNVDKIATCKALDKAACLVKMGDGGAMCLWKEKLEANMDDCVIHRNQDSNLFVDLTILFGTILLFVGALKFNKWTMTVSLGKNLIALYVIYLLIQAIQQFALKGCSSWDCCEGDDFFCHVNSRCISSCADCPLDFTKDPPHTDVAGQYCMNAEQHTPYAAAHPGHGHR